MTQCVDVLAGRHRRIDQAPAHLADGSDNWKRTDSDERRQERVGVDGSNTFGQRLLRQLHRYRQRDMPMLSPDEAHARSEPIAEELRFQRADRRAERVAWTVLAAISALSPTARAVPNAEQNLRRRVAQEHNGLETQPWDAPVVLWPGAWRQR